MRREPKQVLRVFSPRAAIAATGLVLCLSGSTSAVEPANARPDGNKPSMLAAGALPEPLNVTPVRELRVSSGKLPNRGSMIAATRLDEFADDDGDRISLTRAALYSLVLPGAGQWYAGARGRAAGFIAADAVIWAAFGYFETVGAAKRNDFHVYARVHAGIDPSGKDDTFYKTITFYDSRAEYNSLARVFDPRRPYYSDTTFWDWQWDSEASRAHYRTIRNQSNEAFNRVKFTIGALALNRLVAALDAMRVARSANRRARMESTSWQIHFDGNPVASNPAFAVTFSRNF